MPHRTPAGASGTSAAAQGPKSIPAARARATATAVPRSSAAPGAPTVSGVPVVPPAGAAARVVRSKEPAAE
ncbi:hypothetical protein SCANM63S_09537 [Streptomyces canarius]